MILSTALIAGISGLALGFVYNITEPKISAAKKAKEELAIKNVLPDFERKEDGKILMKGEKDSISYSAAFNGDQLVGIAVNTYSMNGFSGAEFASPE